MPYVGEIRMFAGNFPPVGWAFCDGQPIAVSENDALFALIGTTYGGDGEETFNLPNLQSRIPIHAGTGVGGVVHQLGEAAGVETVTLSTQQIPNHSHPLVASTNVGQDTAPTGKVLAQMSGGGLPYIQDTPDSAMRADAVGTQGGSQPHENCQPFLCINYIISLFGRFPSQN